MKTSGQNQPGKKKVKAQKSTDVGIKQVRGKAQRKAAENFDKKFQKSESRPETLEEHLDENDLIYDRVPSDTLH
jgi:hypothetical protein